MVLTDKLRKRLNTNVTRPSKKLPSINMKALRKVASRPIKDFHVYKHWGSFTKIKTMGGDLFYKDNGADILLVAHLDHIQPFHWAGVLKFKGETKIFCSNVDDRVGAYIILDMLAETGIKYDILLTTNEEQRASSAIWFEAPIGKKYNWIAEFDRTGNDVVAYQYKTNMDWVKSIQSEGFNFNYGGSYSDIVDLEQLGVCAMNIGIGMYNYHEARAHVVVETLREQVAKFLSFYEHYCEIKFEFMPRLNKLTKTGFVFDPMIVGTFNQEELKFAEEELYEKLVEGTDPEIGETLTLYQIRSLIEKKTRNLLGKDKTIEPEKSLVLFPVNSTRPKIISDNLHLVEWNKCVECGKQFEIKPWYTGGRKAFCDICHAKNVDKQPSIETKNTDPQSVHICNLVTSTHPHVIGGAIKAVRENFTQLTVGELTDLLTLSGNKSVKNKIKHQNQRKGKELPIITQKIMAALISEAELGIQERTSVISLQKWLSKVESGHRLIWEDPKEIDVVKRYIGFLYEHSKSNWHPLLDKIEHIINIAIHNNENGKPLMLPAAKEKLVVKAKFSLRTTEGKNYKLVTEQSGELKIWKWQKISEGEILSSVK